MTKFATALAFAMLVCSGLVGLNATPAEAKGGKEYFVQDYTFSQAMHGYQGQSGNYYCSYHRIPNRVCVPTASGEKCKVVSWTLRQMCQ